MRRPVGSLHVDVLEGSADWTQPWRSSGAVCCSVIDGADRPLPQRGGGARWFRIGPRPVPDDRVKHGCKFKPLDLERRLYRPTMDCCYFQRWPVL